MDDKTNRPRWPDFFLIIFVPIIGMALGVGVTIFLNIGQTDYSSLIVNLFFLTACSAVLAIFKFSREDLGFKIVKGKLQWHVLISLVVLSIYMLFYIFVIRLSSLKSFSARTSWGLLTYLVVVIAEELYFRGMLYRLFEERFSAKTALIVTSLLFGLFHARQGLRGMISKSFTGWIFGSVRYSSGMIFLLIFPVHFTYNAVWLLFEGDWNNPPTWVIFALPALEFLLGLAIVSIHDKRLKSRQYSF